MFRSAAGQPSLDRTLQFLCTVFEEIAYANYQAWVSAKLPTRASSSVSRVEVLPALGPFGGSQKVLAGPRGGSPPGETRPENAVATKPGTRPRSSTGCR